MQEVREDRPHDEMFRVREVKITEVKTELEKYVLEKQMYGVFTITEGQIQYFQYRRYSDFEWLQKELMVQFPGVIVPSIPDKDLKVQVGLGEIKGINDDETRGYIVSYRKCMFELFLRRILEHPALQRSQAVLAFLTHDKDSLERYKQNSDWALYQKENNVVQKGLDFFSGHFTKLTNKVPPRQTDQTDAQFKEDLLYLKQQRDILSKLQQSTKNVFELKRKQMEAEIMTFDALDQMVMSLDLNQDKSKQLREAKLETQDNSRKSYTAFNDDVLVEIDFTKNSLDMAKQIIQERDEILERLHILQFDLQTKSAGQERQEMEARARRDQQRVQALTKNFIAEFSQFKEGLHDQIKQTLKKIVLLNQEHHKKLNVVWSEIRI